MNFVGTRGAGPVTLVQALQRGIAPDGGLYVPERFESLTPADFDGLDSVAQIAGRMMAPIFAGSRLEGQLQSICDDALSFAMPLRPVKHPQQREGALSVLELFHGPTAAFKDVGARFLAACMQHINARAEAQVQPLTILVATSGDTGSAVASAFYRRPGINILILFPHGQVSPRQEHQLCCWDTNVRALSVNGAFDDCQRLVKEAFADESMRTRHRLSSANSINIGRLLPQAAYYAASSLWHWRANGECANYIVPTGNLGNAMACIWARQMGLPIGQVLLATNANRPIPDYLNSGDWQPRASISTVASAMDVGNPSNMERLRDLFPAFDELSQAVSAVSVEDAQIEEQIRQDAVRLGQIWCPHTATAMHAYDHALSQAQRDAGHWIAVATAHPAKFEAIVEPLAGHAVGVPPALATLLRRPTQVDRIDARLGELRRCLDAGYPDSQPS